MVCVSVVGDFVAFALFLKLGENWPSFPPPSSSNFRSNDLSFDSWDLRTQVLVSTGLFGFTTLLQISWPFVFVKLVDPSEW